MVKKEWALIVFAKEKLMASAGNEKFLKAQEGAIKDGLSTKAFRQFSNESQLRLFETNKKFYKVKDAVTIEYFTKNNPEIIFNIYQLNSKNYYFDNLSEIPVDISLSGAVPLKSVTKKYSKDKSIIRRADSITIKSLSGRRGIFIIDMIGKNISTRAFIRKGELRFIYEQTDGGYDFYVFDENYNQIMKPKIYMDGVEYTVTKKKAKEEKKGYGDEEKGGNGAEKPGKITLPFSSDIDRAEQLIIIEDSTNPSSAVLRSFRRQCKTYELRGGFYVDRENLLSKQQAKLLVRSNLYLCQEQTSLAIAKNSYVTLEFKTLDGDLKKDVRRVLLSDNNDTEIIFTVPTNLRELSCRLDTTVAGKNLNIKYSFKVNGIDACPFIADVFLLPNNKNGYYLLTVGKNGEIFGNEKLEIELYHKFFRSNRCVSCTVTTDNNGLFELGKLDNITSIRVKPVNNVTFFSEKEFNLLQDLVNVPSRICRKEGTVIRIPFSAVSDKPKISIYDGQYSSDISKAAAYKNGYVVIEKLPPGDYIVYIDDILSAKVDLHVSGGKMFDCHLGNYVLSNSRILQLSEDTPLQITNVKSGGDSDNMEIQLNGYNSMTRCHVIVTSLLPVFTPYQSLCAPIRYPDVIDFVTLSNSTYTKTQKCDAEFMYILGRNKKKTEKYNGNQLYAPSLIFGKYAAPQDIRNVANEPSPVQLEKIQAIFKSRYENILEESFAAQFGKCDDTSNVEFLPQPSLVFSNLKPNDKGVIAVPDFKKSEFRCVQIIATDDDNTALLNYVLNNGAPIGNKMPTSDIRLNPGFDPKKHYSPQRKIVCLNKDESLTIEDFNASEYIPFEKLSALFDLYSGLTGETDKDLQIEFEKFRVLTQWNTLSENAKLDFYDKFMCNEVNYFLYRRDRQFFENSIKPCLENKLRKEFMDLYLLNSADLNQYGDAYLFSTLNTFEQILFASMSKDKDGIIKATIRSIEESANLIPRNPRNEDRIFAGARYRNRVDLVGESGGNDDEQQQQPQRVEEQGNDDNAEEKKDPDNPEAGDEMEEEKGFDDGTGNDGNNNNNNNGGGDEYDPFSFDDTIMFEERGYYNVPGSVSTTSLIQSTKFWKDYALFILQDGGKGTFLSPYVGTAISNINEMLLSLSIIDLPLEANEPVIKRARGSGIGSGKVTLTGEDGASIIFLEELVESSLISSTLSVHSNYFDPRDPSEIVHGEKVDKFVVGTFETRKIYGCRSVITNVSSVEQEIEVLRQIPSGAIAVNGSYITISSKLKLSPFMTERLTYYFYFPAPSEKGNDFRCFPVHINKNGNTIAYSLDERLIKMQVVGAGDEIVQNKKSSDNKNNWDYITGQNGTSKDIINFLSTNPRAYEVDLSKLGDRLARDTKFFDNVTAVLKQRGIYDECVWKYSMVSDKGGAELSEYLSQQNKFLEYIHPYFKSDNFNYDPFDRFDWMLTEFSPLISSRTQCDGVIQELSDKFLDEYGKFLLLVAFRSFSKESINIIDKLIFVQYLIYQERIYEAKKLFNSIPEKDAKDISSLYYEYLQSFLSIYDGIDNLQSITMKCMSWKAKPLPAKILKLWQNLEDIAKEVEKPETVSSIFDNDFINEEYNKNTPFIDFSIISKKEQRTIDISFRGLSSCVFNFYVVDLELLFSESPFESNDKSKLSNLIGLIYPNEILKVSLPKESSSPPDKKYKPTDGNIHHYIELPANYKGINSIIEVVGVTDKGEIVKSVQPLNDNSFAIQFDKTGKLGQCRIVYNNKKDKENFKKPIPGSYIKVYSKNKNNAKSQFYKDGYTDIRGRFSYKKLSTNQLSQSQQLSMFVQTPTSGSTVIDIKI